MASQLEPWGQLGGKVVMVTGASSGIGREFCLDLAKYGCRIIAAARRIDRLESLCDEINRFPDSAGSTQNRIAPQAVAVELDVNADGSVIDAAVQKAWDAFGTIDALINNAGVSGSVKSPLDSSVDEWNSIFKTNLTGTWLVSKYVCQRMRDARKGGSVINISSIGGINRGQLPGSAIYSSSKAAVNTLTKMMALELGAYNIRVNSISPGLFRSEITEGLMQRDWLQNVALRTVPLRTFGTSDPALTSLARYLIHDSSGYEDLSCVEAWTVVMVGELGVHNIKVKSISPGIFKSEITEKLMEKDWFENVSMRTIPLRTHGTLDPALTSLVWYLIHDSSEYVSGNIFIVDAGAILPGVPLFSSLSISM